MFWADWHLLSSSAAYACMTQQMSAHMALLVLHPVNGVGVGEPHHIYFTVLKSYLHLLTHCSLPVGCAVVLGILPARSQGRLV